MWRYFSNLKPSGLFLWQLEVVHLHVLFSASDINECKERSACRCDGCSCKNTWGSYECKCKGNLLYIKEQDACIGKIFPPTFVYMYSLSFQWSVWSFVHPHRREKRIALWVVPHPLGTGSCGCCWLSWVYILQIQAQGMYEINWLYMLL